MKNESETPTVSLPLLAWAALVCLELVGPATAEQQEQPYQVSSVLLGDEIEERYEDCASLFVEQLVRKGLPAEVQGRFGPTQWHQTPSSEKRGRRLVLAMARLRERLELLLFRWREPGGGLSLVARQPASSIPQGPPLSRAECTGPAQDRRFAARYLADQAAQRLQARDAEPAREVTGIEVKLPEGTAPHWRGALQALTYAAAHQAGLEPTTAESAARLVVSVSRRELFHKVDLRWTESGRDRSFSCAPVPREALFEVLSAAVRNVAQWGGVVSDLRYLTPTPDALFGLAGERLLFTSGGRAGSLDLGNGSLSWLASESDARRQRVSPRVGPDGLALYQHLPLLGRLLPEADPQVTLDKQGCPHPWGFQLTGDARWLAVAGDRQLRLRENGKLLWTHQTETPLDCGPLVPGDRLVAGEEDGDLHCFSLAKEKRLLWTVPTGERLYGPLEHVPGDPGLILASSLEGRLFAASTADGRVVWRADLDDRIVGEPVIFDLGIAVASGSGGVRLLDRKTGAVLKQREHPVALKHFVATAECLVCCDIEGTTWFLSSDDLRVIRELKMPAFTHLAPSSRAPADLGDTEEMSGEHEPVILAADASGVIYFISIPGGRSDF